MYIYTRNCLEHQLICVGVGISDDLISFIFKQIYQDKIDILYNSPI